MDPNRHHNALNQNDMLHWYQIQSILGQGGFGITYLARDTNLDQLVAIKEYLPSEFSTRDQANTVQPISENHTEIFDWGKKRFLDEAKTLAQFKHPNVVRVSSFFENNNTGYMVMEYEDGVDLSELIKAGESFDEARLLGILLPVLDGLGKIHEQGFIHRDIKPANIFIRKDGSPVLIDFGSARQAIGGQTKTMTSLVTPGYAPFEQYHDAEGKQGPWTDIYSLGSTCYCMLTGKPPIDALKRGMARLDHSTDAYLHLTDLRLGKYSEHLLQAIDHALEFKETDRPQNVADWAAMLRGEAPVPQLQAATRLGDNTAAAVEALNDGKTRVMTQTGPAAEATTGPDEVTITAPPATSRPGEAQPPPVDIDSSTVDIPTAPPASVAQPRSKTPVFIGLGVILLAVTAFVFYSQSRQATPPIVETAPAAIPEVSVQLDESARIEAEKAALAEEQKRIAAEAKKLKEEKARIEAEEKLQQEQARQTEEEEALREQQAQLAADKEALRQEQARIAAEARALQEEKARVESEEKAQREEEARLAEENKSSEQLAAEKKRQEEAAKKAAEAEALREEQERIAAENKRKAELAAEKKRQAELAAKKAEEKQRQAEIAANKAAERKRQADLAASKAAEEQRKKNLALQQAEAEKQQAALALQLAAQDPFANVTGVYTPEDGFEEVRLTQIDNRVTGEIGTKGSSLEGRREGNTISFVLKYSRTGYGFKEGFGEFTISPDGKRLTGFRSDAGFRPNTAWNLNRKN